MGALKISIFSVTHLLWGRGTGRIIPARSTKQQQKKESKKERTCHKLFCACENEEQTVPSLPLFKYFFFFFFFFFCHFSFYFSLAQEQTQPPQELSTIGRLAGQSHLSLYVCMYQSINTHTHTHNYIYADIHIYIYITSYMYIHYIVGRLDNR